MSDFLLDEQRDLVFTDGKLTVLRGPDARAQRIGVALRHVQDEWFLDRAAGTDFFGKVLGKSSELSRRAEIRRRVLSVPGVVEVTSIELRVDPKTRALGGTVQALDVTGVPLAVALEGVF
jgi:hypothetical protein